MTQQIELKELEASFPKSFYPLARICDHSTWETKDISSVRCSVFPWFFTSVEELELYVDNAKEEQRDKYRQSFLGLLRDVLSITSVYTRLNSQKDLQSVEFVSLTDVINLTEKASCDLFIPELKLIFLGHDDFGFIILSDRQRNIPAQLEELVRKHELFLVSPSFSDEVPVTADI